MNDLYAADPRERLKAARQLASWSLDERKGQWPLHWFGAANAWLVFLGPSPGDSPGTSVNWQRDRLPKMGRLNEHFASYLDGSGFWTRIRSWTANAFASANVFADAVDAWSVTMVGNVAASQAGAAGKIPASELRLGLRGTRLALELVRPRLIVPMHKRVTELLLPLYTEMGYAVLERGITDVPAKNQRFPSYRPRWFLLRGPSDLLLIAEAPQHPSRRNFYEPAHMDKYLADMIERALP